MIDKKMYPEANPGGCKRGASIIMVSGHAHLVAAPGGGVSAIGDEWVTCVRVPYLWLL